MPVVAVGAAVALVAAAPAGLGYATGGSLLSYFGTQAAYSAAETGIEYALTPDQDWAGFGATYLKNFAVNSVTGGLVGKGTKAARAAAWLTRQGIEVGAETAFDVHVRGIPLGNALWYNAVGSVAGEAIFAGARFGARRLFARQAGPKRLFVHLRPDQYDHVVASGYLGRGYQGAMKVLLPPFDEGRIWATAYSRDQLTGVRGFFRSITEGLNPLTVGKRTKTIELIGEAAQAFSRPRGRGFSYNIVGWLKGAVGTQRQFRGQLRYSGTGTISSLEGAIDYTRLQLLVYRLGEIERLRIYAGIPSAILWWLSDE